MNTELIMQNLQDGLLLCVIGMGVVMIFLTVMMGVMKVMDMIMAKLAILYPEEVVQEPVRRTVQQKTNDDVAVAIAAAAKFKNIFLGGK